MFFFGFLVCVFARCGTLGGGELIHFDCNKKEVSKEINSFYLNHPGYLIPDKWKILDDWKERGYDFLDSRIFYFHSPPEEMYYLTFIGDSNSQANTSEINISIRAVSIGKPKWLLNSDMSEKENKRIENRLKLEVLSQLRCLKIKLASILV